MSCRRIRRRLFQIDPDGLFGTNVNVSIHGDAAVKSSPAFDTQGSQRHLRVLRSILAPRRVPPTQAQEVVNQAEPILATPKDSKQLLLCPLERPNKIPKHHEARREEQTQWILRRRRTTQHRLENGGLHSSCQRNKAPARRLTAMPTALSDGPSKTWAMSRTRLEWKIGAAAGSRVPRFGDHLRERTCNVFAHQDAWIHAHSGIAAEAGREFAGVFIRTRPQKKGYRT